jgi:glycerol-3-phosphate dehydrogenase (NAD(P)+)
LPAPVHVSSHLGEVLQNAEIAVAVVPSRHFRTVLSSATDHIRPGATIVSATKGLEDPGLCRMSQVITELLPGHAVAVLSGPTFAKEIAAGEPAAMVIAAEDLSVAEEMQQALSTSALRLYASSDVVGTEIGAALKNVIAIGAGICSGLGLGSNTVAALVTRGLAEITRLAVSMGGNARTLSGLAGLGDLVLTATGDLSRNRFVGIQLGRGRGLEQIQADMIMVAEGVATCRAARLLGIRKGLELPLIGQMYQVLYEAKQPRQAIRELMERPLTTE